MTTFKRFFAEFFGTMMLVVFACGIAAVTGCNTAKPDTAYFMTALAFGLVLCVLAYAIGHISGCHINPAVSFGKFLCGKLSGWDFLGYVVAQTFGGIAGAAVLYGVLGSESSLGANGLFEGDWAPSFLIEAILTAFFVFIVLAVTERAQNEKVAGVCVGGALTLVHLFGISFTGTSVNPARSFGPALFVGGDALSNVWVFWVAPLLGALVAALLFLVFFGKLAPAKAEKKPVEEKEASEK